jgi:small subunit ribosomal protein S1
VVSRRALLEKERDTLKKEILKVLEEGVILEGTVKNITSYGAFVDLGGIDGILHISDMSWGRIGHPSEMVKVGDHIKVVVLKFDAERERISLGMKQIMPDPWNTVADKYPIGTRLQGKVVSLVDYGAFVELERGVEGLIHISEMSWTKKVAHPSKVVQVGETVEVIVLNVDPNHRRISLGLKQVMPNPWEQAKEKYPVGTVIKGPVRSVTDFGIFVGVEDGIDGLVHVSDLHWTKKVKHPSELYKKGDIVEAKVLGVDVQNERFSLGIKQLSTDPWHVIAQKYPVGSKVKGEVASVPDFGVFVRLEEGIEGLIHVSQLSTERVDKPSSLFKPGDSVEAEVINVDPHERKLGLSIRALKKTEERQEMENYLKREKEGGRFSFEAILNEELRLDRDEEPRPEKGKGGNPQ